MFDKILIANRGEIATRVIKTARKLGIRTVAVHSDADARAMHVSMADEAVAIGPAPAAQSYLVTDRIIDAVRRTGAQAVHPGYGFLSENAAFAEAVASAGAVFIGPPPNAIRAMGDKITSKKIAAEAGVNTVPGFMGLIDNADEAVRIAREIGYPVMIKASAGGGGKGMRIAHNDAEAREGFQSSRNEAAASFGDDRIFIEKFVTSPRHIEIQVLADSHGNCVYLFERECSIQRRNQKVIEEAPSPFLDRETRCAMGEQAVRLAQAVGYESAGTVEFIVDEARNFYFLEMNTRLQVEHPVTELITGVDLVEQMIRVAGGARLPFTQDDLRMNGWAIESRLYAEDPFRGFLPSIGRLTRYRPPVERAAGPMAQADNWVPGQPGSQPPTDATGIRNDTGVAEGGEIAMYYDPMIAKLCTWAPSRAEAIDAMQDALDSFEIEGIGHNLPFLSAVMDHPRFHRGDITTGFIAEEYPAGFHGARPDDAMIRRFAATAAVMHRSAEMARGRIDGAEPSPPGRDWVVSLGERDIAVTMDAQGVPHVDGTPVPVSVDWQPGQTVARVTDSGAVQAVQVAPIPDGFRLRSRGSELQLTVRRPRAAAFARLMPDKSPPDRSKQLLCPMPGIIVRVEVAEGDVVEAGQPLAAVEAMKMENVLRAERPGTVRTVRVKPGQSLGVDEVILDFA